MIYYFTWICVIVGFLVVMNHAISFAIYRVVDPLIWATFVTRLSTHGRWMDDVTTWDKIRTATRMFWIAYSRRAFGFHHYATEISTDSWRYIPPFKVVRLRADDTGPCAPVEEIE